VTQQLLSSSPEGLSQRGAGSKTIGAMDYCRRYAEKGTRIWSFLNGPFDTTKQNSQRSSNELRLFEPGKLRKSFQYLAVGLGQPDRGLFRIGWMPHDNDGKAIRMPNCVASVWRLAEIGTNLGYG